MAKVSRSSIKNPSWDCLIAVSGNRYEGLRSLPVVGFLFTNKSDQDMKRIIVPISIFLLGATFAHAQSPYQYLNQSPTIRIPIKDMQRPQTESEKLMEGQRQLREDQTKALQNTQDQVWKMGQTLDNQLLRQEIEELRRSLNTSSDYEIQILKADLTLKCMDIYGRSHYDENTNTCECDPHALFFTKTNTCEIPAIACVIHYGPNSAFISNKAGGGSCTEEIKEEVIMPSHEEILKQLYAPQSQPKTSQPDRNYKTEEEKGMPKDGWLSGFTTNQSTSTSDQEPMQEPRSLFKRALGFIQGLFGFRN